MSSLHLVLAGAPLGNGNRGVEALGRSVVDAVDRETEGTMLSVLDDGWGVRADTTGRYGRSVVEHVGVRHSRRWHRPESWAQIQVAQRVAPTVNPVATRLARADAVFDLSGGDSFTDLYGQKRFDAVAAPKHAALRSRRPLILLPQTYGPFTDERFRAEASRLVRASAIAYARDPRSYELLLTLAGPGADPDRIRSGVDVAFGLEPRRPGDDVVALLDGLSGGGPLAGVNISGLLLGEAARARFGLEGDYVETMTDLVRGLVRSGAHVVLVPHVHVPGGGGESDIAAIQIVRDRLSETERSQTSIVPSTLDAAELKWVIRQLDWFVGSRMHATIASLSSTIPTFGYAYSDKTKGVFETCGLGDQVGDARDLAGADAVSRMLESFTDRAGLKARLEKSAPPVVERARAQLRDVLGEIEAWHTQDAKVGSIG